jgi:hypothetical protein
MRGRTHESRTLTSSVHGWSKISQVPPVPHSTEVQLHLQHLLIPRAPLVLAVPPISSLKYSRTRDNFTISIVAGVVIDGGKHGNANISHLDFGRDPKLAST